MKLLEKLKKKFRIKGTILRCEYCNSIRVSFGNVEKKSVEMFDHVSYPIKCEDCGAVGQVIERWLRGVHDEKQ